MKTQLARSALWYARHGWTVFPLRPGTKEPFKGIGVYQATSDVTQVTAYWERWPGANIGLHCGGCNLLAIDIDSYKDTYSGSGPLAHADQETLTSLTAGGGTHLIYRVEDGKRWGNRKGDFPPGIDVRGWGGYIVLAPSKVRYTGEEAAEHGVADGYVGQYTWETGYRPDEIEPLLIPATIAAMLDAGRRPERLAGPADSLAVDLSLRLVESILDELDIQAAKITVHEGTGRMVTMQPCPFMPKEYQHASDKASFIAIAPDGHISAGCLHERCRDRLRAERIGGWQWLQRAAAAGYIEAPQDEAIRQPDRYVSERTRR